MNLEELKIACRHEFVKEENEIDVLGLSYWIPNNGELVTGIRTPPVLLTNDASIRFFIKQLRVNGSMNLFVRLGKSTIRGNDIVPFSGTFTTPQTQIKERTFLHGDTSGSKELICSSVTSKSKPLDVVDCGSVLTPLEFDDLDLITAVELVESRVSSETTNAAEECGSGWDSFEEDVEGEHDRALIEDVEPRGYDTEFWEPFLESAYGGSNAAEIMLSDTEEKDETPGLKFQRRDVSDVEFMSGNKAAEVNEKVNCLIGHDVPVWVDGRIPKNCSTPRSLESVDDEEFDLEPMFDDRQYVPSDIPDLDIDERDEEVYVGKTFNSKKDCQISLAIYAIKNRFHFKQTRTKLNYFVLSCADERCDWRILAREIPDVGYYEIRKAKLDHICDIDTRNGYKRKASSQIIASVYKAKFGSGSGGPRAMDLQQMILEDLRVNASYMKCYRAKEIAMYNIRGSEDESYVKLPEYCHMLKLANPGTVADIETEVDEAGNYRFKYMFLAFGASIHGFRRTRLVLVVDGTHLTGRYKGVLLTASGQD